MPKFRKKPVVIEAWKFTKENYRKGAPDFVRESDGAVVLFSQYGGDMIGGDISTLEGNLTISENDYIIKGVQGEFYPCKPDIFEAIYEPA